MNAQTLNEIAQAVHTNAKIKGFHPQDETIREFMANQCNNLHGEVSELWDAWRAGKEYEPCDKAAKMSELGIYPLNCTEEELADIIIRALDLSARLGIDIGRAVEAKHQYNMTREYKHGKKN
ncbi:MAG: hypothetical protein KGL39_21650 [Patescibacteria group bacterium]|nr:hypothetical protein [Patescibacteria group bacterium]